jgi:hypothetical protein
MTSTLRSEHLAPARDQASESVVRWDNLTLARKEGWRCFVNAPARIPPEPLTTRELRALGEGALANYNRRRLEWHANLGPIKTPQLADLHEDLWDIVDSNAQDGDKAKGAVAIDAFPGLGKTTSVLAFAKQRQTLDFKTPAEKLDELLLKDGVATTT